MPLPIKDVSGAEKIVYVYISRIIASLGIAGNLLNLIILRRRALNDSPYTYLTALAISDFFVLAIMLGLGAIRCGDCTLKPKATFYGKVYEHFIYLPLSNMGSLTSVFLTLAMTVERFIFVRFPLKARIICDRKKARSIVAFVVSMAILLHVPSFFMHQVYQLRSSVLILDLIFSPSQISSSPFNIKDNIIIDNSFLLLPIHCNIDGFNGNIISRNLSENVISQDKLNATAELCATMQRIYDSKKFEHYHFVLIYMKNDSIEQTFNKNDTEILYCNIMRCEVQQNETDFSEHCGNDTIEYFSHNQGSRNQSKLIGLYQPKHINLNALLEINNQYHTVDQILKCVNYKNHFLNVFKSTQVRLTLSIINSKIICNLVNIFPCLKKHLINSVNTIVKNTEFYGRYYRAYIHIVIFSELISTLTMAVLNIYLIKTLRHSYRVHQNLRASFQSFPMKWFQDQQRLTITLIIITTLSTICIIFTTLVNEPLASKVFGKNYQNLSIYKVVLLCNNMAYIISNSINFLLYATFNIRFRNEMRVAFREYFQFCFGIRKKQRKCPPFKWKSRESQSEVFVIAGKTPRLDSSSTVEEQDSAAGSRISLSSTSENNTEVNKNDNLFL